jgi:hypothetical protein
MLDLLSSQYGTVVGVLLTHHSKKSTSALVEFNTQDEARAAMRAFENMISHPRLGKVKLCIRALSSLSLPQKESVIRHGSSTTSNKDVKKSLIVSINSEPPSTTKLETDLTSKIDLDNVPEGFYLYVPRMPTKASTKSLHSLFSCYTYPGEKCFASTYARLDIEDPSSFGIVAYSSEADAIAALAAMKGTDPFFTGKDIVMENPAWRRGLKAVGIHKDVKLSSLVALFEMFGPVRAVRVLDGENADDSVEVRVEYSKEGVAMKALVGSFGKTVDVSLLNGELHQQSLQLEFV